MTLTPSTNPFEFTTHEMSGPDGRPMVIWRLRREGTIGVPIVLAPGFAQRMDHVSPLAMYLATNGFDVYRYDALDHVGLSDGDIGKFTMTTHVASLRAVVDWVCATRDVASVGVVALSVTAFAAYHLAAQSDRVAFLVTAVGVVHLSRILHTIDTAFRNTKQTRVEGSKELDVVRATVDTDRFMADAKQAGWIPFEATIAALQRAPQPMVAFITLADEWVDPDDVRRAFAEGTGGPRRIVELGESSHDLVKDPAVARLFFQKALAEIVEPAWPAEKRAVSEPAFDRLAAQMFMERELQRARPSP